MLGPPHTEMTPKAQSRPPVFSPCWMHGEPSVFGPCCCCCCWILEGTDVKTRAPTLGLHPFAHLHFTVPIYPVHHHYIHGTGSSPSPLSWSFAVLRSATCHAIPCHFLHGPRKQGSRGRGTASVKGCCCCYRCRCRRHLLCQLPHSTSPPVQYQCGPG